MGRCPAAQIVRQMLLLPVSLRRIMHRRYRIATKFKLFSHPPQTTRNRIPGGASRMHYLLSANEQHLLAEGGTSRRGVGSAILRAYPNRRLTRPLVVLVRQKH